MKKPFFHGVGGVVSADIAAPEHERELDFYSKVLTTGDAPLWRDDLSNNLGSPIIGLGARSPEYEALPVQWMPHFQVADVAASAAGAVEMGGKEIMRSESQWAVLTDPDGAAFGVIPAASDDASPDEPFGCIAWLTLTTPNASASRDFYQRVVGWTPKPVETEDAEAAAATFEMQIDEDRSAAHIHSRRGEREEIPPVWLIHLPVRDLAESLRRATQNGGAVIQEFAAANYAVVRDPVGVHFALQAG